MGNFYVDVIKTDRRYRSLAAVRDMDLLEPGFRVKVGAFITSAKAMGRDVRVAETYRSQWLQHKYWTQHKTQLAHVGTHGYGLAVDLAYYIDGVYQTDGLKY